MPFLGPSTSRLISVAGSHPIAECRVPLRRQTNQLGTQAAATQFPRTREIGLSFESCVSQQGFERRTQFGDSFEAPGTTRRSLRIRGVVIFEWRQRALRWEVFSVGRNGLRPLGIRNRSRNTKSNANSIWLIENGLAQDSHFDFVTEFPHFFLSDTELVHHLSDDPAPCQRLLKVVTPVSFENRGQ